MNSPLETRLKAALVARAELVTHDSLGPAEPVRSPRRLPLRLIAFAVPLTAAAAIAAVVVTGLTPQQPSAHRVPPATGGVTKGPTATPTPAATATRAPDDGGPKLSGTGTTTRDLAVDPRTVSLDLVSYPALVPGTRDPSVRVLQKLLNGLDYQAGPLDGYFGPRTGDALARFRLQRRLPPSDRVMPHDWAALLSSGARPVLRKGMRNDDVRRLQRALTAALGRKVTIDGYFGSQTEVAVRDYQKLNGLPSTAVVDSVTWAYLAGRSIQEKPPAGAPTGTPAPSSEPTPVPSPSPSSTPTKPATPSPPR